MACLLSSATGHSHTDASLRRARIFNSLSDLYTVDVTQPVAERRISKRDPMSLKQSIGNLIKDFSQHNVLPRVQ